MEKYVCSVLTSARNVAANAPTALIHIVETRRSEEGDGIVRLTVIAACHDGCNGSAANCRKLAANGSASRRWLRGPTDGCKAFEVAGNAAHHRQHVERDANEKTPDDHGFHHPRARGCFGHGAETRRGASARGR